MHNGIVTDNFLRAAFLLIVIAGLGLGVFVAYIVWDSIRRPEQ